MNGKNPELTVEAKAATKKTLAKAARPNRPFGKSLTMHGRNSMHKSLRVRVSNVSALRLASASIMQMICGFGLIY